MHDTIEKGPNRPWKPLVASLIGVAIVAPVPVMAGAPHLIPGWLLDRLMGAPVIAWAMLLLMLGLVFLVLGTISFMDSAGG
jgi:hypothetical protein